MLEKRAEAPVYTNWLEGYNMSTTGEEKKPFLDAGLAEDPSEANQLRKKLWEARYTKKGQLTGYDAFMAQWMELGYQQKQLEHVFGKGRARKKLKKIAQNLMMEEGTTEELREVLFREYVNLIAVYIDLCQKDKNYKSVILGMGTMKDETLVHKIANDVYRTGCGAAILGNMTEELQLVMQAAKSAYLLSFPQEISAWNAAEKKFNDKYGVK
jgi:hypothetical protein